MTDTAATTSHDRISTIETARVSLRAHPTLTVRGARGTHDHSDFLLVRLVTEAGHEGFGEVSATLQWSGEDAETAGVGYGGEMLTRSHVVGFSEHIQQERQRGRD